MGIKMYLIFYFFVLLSLTPAFLGMPFNAFRSKRAVFDIIPDISQSTDDSRTVLCRCKESDFLCLTNNVNNGCAFKNTFETHEEKRHRKTKLRLLFRNWLQKKRGKRIRW